MDVAATDASSRAGVEVTVSQAIRVQGITCEVQQLLGEGTIRCVAMEGTEGLRRGEDAEVLGLADSGPRRTSNTRPNLPNVLGQPVDGMGDVTHRAATLDTPPITGIRRPRYHPCHLRDWDQGG